MAHFTSLDKYKTELERKFSQSSTNKMIDSMFMQSHHGIRVNFLRLIVNQECLVLCEGVFLITECIISSIDCRNYILGTTWLHLPPR